MSTHAQLSPSSAERWMACPGSVILNQAEPDQTSSYAEEGTAAHEMAQLTLESGASDAAKFIGKTAENGVLMTEDMAEHVMTYVNNVRDYAKGHELMVEQRLSIAHLTGEEDAKGTSDAVILTDDELQVHDLKYGMGVRKDAEQNPQLMIYALAALREFEMLGDFKRVRLVIHQPRLGHLSEWDCSIEELQAFAKKVGDAAHKAGTASVMFAEVGEGHWKDTYLRPGDTQCKFCKAKAGCVGVRDFVIKQVTGEDFEDLDAPLEDKIQARIDAVYGNDMLGLLLANAELIESWVKAIRSKAEIELLAGRAVPGFKLVQGRMGARAWSSAVEVEEVMKSMRLKKEEMYDFKLISPTSAEKLLKATPKRWNRITPLITQKPGGPSVAPESDKRPAMVVQSQEEFDPVVDETEMEGLV